VITIRQGLARIKGNLQHWLPHGVVEQLANQFGLGRRQRVLTPVTTTFLFLKQILHGNTACSNLRHLSGLDFSEAAYCKARGRLPLGFCQRLQRAVLGHCLEADAPTPRDRWRGRDVYLVDGSSFSMADAEELRAEFGQPSGQKPGCGFPVAHLLLLTDARTGYIRRALPAPGATHDMSRVAAIHPDVPAGAVLGGDRGFCSYAHLALCRQRQIDGIFRAHQRLLIDFTPGRPHTRPGAKAAKGLPRSRWLRSLGRDDQLVEYLKPVERPEWMTAQQYATLPASLTVRECRYRITIPGRRTQVVTLVTTLLDERRYPASALAQVYGWRWQIEGHLRDLKQTLKMDVLHCQTFPGVLKELALFVTVYNLVRRVMNEAAQRQSVPVQRISFIDALRWLCEARPGEELPRLKVLRDRLGRAEPRVKKRRPKQYDLMRKPRAQLRAKLYVEKDVA
jgi:Transposase DDE domain